MRRQETNAGCNKELTNKYRQHTEAGSWDAMLKYVLEGGDLIPRGRESGQGEIDGGVLKQTYNT